MLSLHANLGTTKCALSQIKIKKSILCFLVLLGLKELEGCDPGVRYKYMEEA